MSSNTKSFPKAVLFDMDGTLLVSTQSAEQSWFSAIQQVARSHDLPVETLFRAFQASYARHKRNIEHDSELAQRDRLEPFEVRRETVQNALLQIGVNQPAYAEEIVHIYEALREQYRQLAPFTIETLQDLRKHEIRLALLTNGNATYQRRKIEQYNLAPFFDSILIEEELGIGKPDIRVYLYALEQLYVTAKEAWIVGDNLEMDIAIPQQLGIYTIWFDEQEKGLPSSPSVHPDRVIHSLAELLNNEMLFL